MATKEAPIKKTKIQKIQTVLGILLLTLSVVLVLSFISFYFNWKEDQSQETPFLNKEVRAENMIGKTGANLGEFFIFRGIGIMAFIVPIITFLLGCKLLLGKTFVKTWKFLSHSIFFIIWIPIFLGTVFASKGLLAGLVGFEMADFLKSILGLVGTLFVLLIALALYFILEFNLTLDKMKNKVGEMKDKSNQLSTTITNKKNELTQTISAIAKGDSTSNGSDDDNTTHINLNLDDDEDINTTINEVPLSTSTISSISTPTPSASTSLNVTPPVVVEPIVEKKEEIITPTPVKPIESLSSDGVQMVVEKAPEEEVVAENDIAKTLVSEFGEYDPKLDLPKYQAPGLDLLKDYSSTGGEEITINNEELEANKNNILTTLANYGIGISNIKATVGPTVTLYEIVPEAGVRISKIKNLEDDIALSLAALGIRIIAPIPGKGTIGIEVPNSKPTIVSMRTAVASAKFQNTDMDLPIVFGKTISNETFVTDLAKMPHLLMAGATGQGKSVGLNAIIASLLYKKHPSELKFVFVDPKKVELTLYNKIERHFLAKLPDTEEAIITDTTKVVHTLNSLCIEMDTRYDLLKKAMVRNLKEYNQKFKERKLNPEDGHKFLPYIVLVIDEFADLIMTAGKEVELPIARLAQLARAIGIHLIIATQRPSVNVITGMIKANFPARVAFRVTSKIDSRTILDGNGADQLIGKGDMLFTTGNELTRIQCAFVDTPEVEKITDFIGSQRGYSDAYLLPEYIDESSNLAGGGNSSGGERDALFREAAEIVVTAGQGSTSLIQRKLSLGYNRAGRIMDQLEEAGIVGPFEGSKARQVKITDLVSLDQFLDNN